MVSQFVLMRGDSLAAQADSELLISASEGAKNHDQPTFLHFNFKSPKEQPVVESCESLKIGKLEKFDQGYCVALDDYNLDVYCGMLPWWQFPDFDLPQGRRILFLPLRGWLENKWYDGPLAHYTSKGSLASFVPCGAPSLLKIPLEEKEPNPEVQGYVRGSFLNSQLKWLSMRTSAALGLAEKIEDQLGDRNQIILEKCDAKELILLCLLRIAFSDCALECEGLPEDSDARTIWKKLCRNLDIRVDKDPRPDGEPQIINLRPFISLIPQESFQPMVEALNYQSPLIPMNLLRDLNLSAS